MGKNNKNNDDDFDVVEYRKFLTNMFPSKHMKEKVKADKKISKKLRSLLIKSNQKNTKQKKSKINMKRKKKKNSLQLQLER